MGNIYCTVISKSISVSISFNFSIKNFEYCSNIINFAHFCSSTASSLISCKYLSKSLNKLWSLGEMHTSISPNSVIKLFTIDP